MILLDGKISINGIASFILQIAHYVPYLTPTFLVGCFDLQVTKSSVMCYGMHIPYQETNCSYCPIIPKNLTGSYIEILERYIAKFSLICTMHGMLILYLQLYNTMQN